MKLRSILIKSICFVCLSALAVAFAGCGKSKSSASVDDNPFAVSNPGKLTSKGYELPLNTRTTTRRSSRCCPIRNM